MSQTPQSSYKADDIKVLEGLDAVRKRPGMYVGSTGKPGLNHLIFEVVDNSIDEAMAGYCTDVVVTIEEGNIVTVTDNGRGIPIDMHKEKKLPAVEVVLTTLHAGGKFEGKGYKVSGGLHGVGVSVVNALGEWLEVDVKRDNKRYTNRYERGKPVNLVGKTEDFPSQETGTIIRFKPDDTIFDDIDFTNDVIDHRLRELAFLNRGVKIVFTDYRVKNEQGEVETKTYQFEGGITSYVEMLNDSKLKLFTPAVYLKNERDTYEVEVSLQYVDDYYDENVVTFANNIRTREGGTHLAGFRSALTRVINNFAKKYDLLKDKKSTFSGQDLREGLTAVISVKLQNPQFEGQTKTKLGNAEVRGIVDSLVDEGLTDYLEANPKVGRAIIGKALIAQRVREATRKAQDLVRRKSSLESTTLPGKLADCSDRNPENCEVFLVEGDSAGGSAKQGRDRNYQAILPLRGKVLNVEKARLDKILANEEIRTLITAIGPGAIQGLAERQDEINEETGNEIETVLAKLRYHKIVIMTDADVDGAHIRTLLLTFFFRYARAVIEAGGLYIAQPPLYLVKKGNSRRYAYNDEELNACLEEFGRDKSTIQRYKGLGEMNPDQLWETTMDPQKRTLLQVKLEDGVKADEIFTMLMGSEVDPRKVFIEKYANEVRWIDV